MIHFQVSITRVCHAPIGSGIKRKLKPGHRPTSVLKVKKQSIIRIQNSDNLCCARAIVTAKAKIENHPQYVSIRHGRQKQKELAVRLHRQASVRQGPCGYDELVKFQECLPEYRLILADADRAFHRKAFSPPGPPEIILLQEKDHYDVITSLPGFFGSSYVCGHCLQPYDHVGQHACQKNSTFCRACRQPDCPDFLEALPRGLKANRRCHLCRREFFGETCFEAYLTKDRQHQTNPAQSVCQTIRRCPTCFKLEDKPENIQRHKCGYATCPSCQEYVEIASHKCFIQPPKRKRGQDGPAAKRCRTELVAEEVAEDEESEKPALHVFFDIEAMQLHQEHEPNLLVAETEEESEPFVFSGKDCVCDFLEWLEELTEEDTRKVTVIAHNFQGYDGYFVVFGTNQIIEQLRSGCKLLEVKHDNIRFIDFLSFFQMPLSAFPKTFGLTELKMGYFPHLFNVPTNQDYVGPIPAKDYYMPESMAPKARKEFEQWHQQQRNNEVEFNFAEELLAYCKSDVHLLKEGCLTFKELFEPKTGFNPFDNITIAAACNQHLRRNRMIPNSIASEPLHGWRSSINQSNVAKEWLTWCDHQLRQSALDQLSPEDMEAHDLMAIAYPDHPHPSYRYYIQHAGNQGEYRIPETRWTVDGYCEDSKTVYEFHGCFWHGCPTCYPVRHEKHRRLLNRTMYDVHEKTKQRIQSIRTKGYQVVQMWECEWNKMKARQPEIKTFVDQLEFV